MDFSALRVRRPKCSKFTRRKNALYATNASPPTLWYVESVMQACTFVAQWRTTFGRLNVMNFSVLRVRQPKSSKFKLRKNALYATNASPPTL